MASPLELLDRLRRPAYWRDRYERFRRRADTIRYLRRTHASREAISKYLRGSEPSAPYLERQRAFRTLASSLRLSNDWFTDNIPHWLSAFDEVRLAERRELRALEIGSWEGLSSYFILHTFPNATLTCVDTWQGADEHKSGDAAAPHVLSSIESVFDDNLACFKDRLVKHKGPSFGFFQQYPAREAYDLVYIDGSHHCDDVLVDAIKCFEMLKVGGLMIFDDYLWRYYPRPIDNPAAAIHFFLRLKQDSYRIVRLYYQLIIQKTAADSTRTKS